MLGLISNLSKYLRYIVAALIVFISALIIVLSFVAPNPGENDTSLDKLPYSYESWFFDYRYTKFLRQNKLPKSPHAMLAQIDDDSIKKLGRFPWSRKVWIDLIHKLQKLGAKVIAFDVIFPEPERSCNLDMDGLFANTIGAFEQGAENIIVSYMRTQIRNYSSPELPDIMYNFLIDTTQEKGVVSRPWFIDFRTFPIEKILSTEPGLAYIDMTNDPDGVFRNYAMYANILAPTDTDGHASNDIQLMPSLGLLAYERYTKDKIKVHMRNEFGSLTTTKGELEVNKYGGLKLNFRGDKEAFHNIPIYKILESDNDDPEMLEAIKGKVVFIGSTAQAAHDFRNTALDPYLPGVYLHMTAVDMLAEGRYFKPFEESAKYTWILLILGALVILMVQQFDNAIFDIFGSGGAIAAVVLLDYYYFLPNGYEIKLFSILLCYLMLYAWDTALSFYMANKEKRHIRGAFSRYVAPSIVDEMLDSPDKLKTGGERKDITVFFSDVRDFTSISEKLTPSELSTCMNHYMNKMTNILFETKGTLDKYIGDAIVGYWGAPVEIEGHAYLGVGAAVKMIEALPEVNEDFKEMGFPEFKVGIGLNTGVCSVGNMGSDLIFSYTALGDHMNLGARLEGLCKPYGAQILISEFTLERLSDEQKSEFVIRALDKVRVKGKEKPVKIFEVLHANHHMISDSYSLEMFNEAYEAYLAKNFDKSIDILKPILEKYPHDVPSNRIKDACTGYLNDPPPADWDGVTTFKTK